MLRIILLGLAGVIALGLLAGALVTMVLAGRIDKRYPPIGSFVEVNGTRLHYVDEGPRDAPAVLLIHGASSNLRDMLIPARASLGGKYRLIAVDRPGHGWSERGLYSATPDAQARTLADFLTAIKVDKAVVFGHSFGTALATAMAVERPDKVLGLVVASPATHPWPSGKTNWYNHLARVPVIGWLFTRTLALPAGVGRIAPATDCVFAPNQVPSTYLADAGIELVMVPHRFMDNSEDLTGLHPHTVRYNARYKDIKTPTIIITGDHDTVVSKDIHAENLARDIAGSRLFVVKNVGHKPDYALADLVAASIETLAGNPKDLDVIAAAAELRVASDRFGPVERCPPTKIND
jgi:pimeloyl-ACP methyl ester carboxylesterase